MRVGFVWHPILHSLLIVALVMIGTPLLISCASRSGASQETSYSALVRKKEDRLERMPNPAGFTFLITCPSGIGGATATVHEGRWPSDLRVRLRYGEGRPFSQLESFTVAAGPRKAVEIRTVQFALEWAEVQVPSELLGAGADTLVIEWVNQYRK